MALFLKNVVFTVLVPGMVAGYVPWRLSAPVLAGRALTAADWVLAAPPFVAGGLIYFWCVWDFATAGRGTPAPIDPPKTLIVRGLYRYLRNPMYVGVLLVIAGWVILAASRELGIYAASVATAFHLFVVFVEEPMLRRKFGESYEAYCRSTSRWWPS